MARLGDHPNIVTVFDVGDENGEPYIVSELMPGGSVAELIADADDHRLPVSEALRIGEQVALALEHAHERGVVHRDLKPANVWLAADGTARLGDFGLAVEADRSRLTSEGMVVGTVAYLAPEQAVGAAPRQAQRSLRAGTSLYEMLTGARRSSATTRSPSSPNTSTPRRFRPRGTTPRCCHRSRRSCCVAREGSRGAVRPTRPRWSRSCGGCRSRCLPPRQRCPRPLPRP